MAFTICILIWAHEGHEDALVDYADLALGIAAKHGAHVVSRVRRTGSSESPLEIQVLRFPGKDLFESFMHDPSRLALSAMRDLAVARTEVIHVEEIS